MPCLQYVLLYVIQYCMLNNDQPERVNHTCKQFLSTQIAYPSSKVCFKTLYHEKWVIFDPFWVAYIITICNFQRFLIRFFGISSSISSGKSMARVSSNILIGIKSLNTFILPSMMVFSEVTRIDKLEIITFCAPCPWNPYLQSICQWFC